MRFECRDDTLEYRGRTRAIKALAWWCGDCDDGILEGQTLADYERVFFDLKAEVDEVLGLPDASHVCETFSSMQYAAG